MNHARMSSAPVSSSALCPACSKPVDSLRAGQVAILDGVFRYFCDAACKNAYVDEISKRPSLDAMTAEPPPVATSADAFASVLPVIVGGVREPRESNAPFFPAPIADHDDAREDEGEPSGIRDQAGERKTTDAELPSRDGESEDIAAQEPLSEALNTDEPEAHVDQEPHEEQGPPTLRSPSVAEAARVSTPRGLELRSRLVALGRSLGAYLGTSAPIAGVVAGVLAAVVSLAGEPAGVLRLPLALGAAATVLARMVLAARERSEPAPWVVGAPVAAGSIFATCSAVLQHPHADAHASFVGLSAAAALTVDILLARARRDVIHARARTMSALAITARVVRGAARAASDARVNSAPDRTGPLEIGVEEVDAALVKPGEQVLVEAGETIPVDGIVAAGEAEVAPWLDSPSLMQKFEGDAVVAGAAVVTGRLRVNATFSGPERAWLRLTQATASRIEVSAPFVAFVRRMVERGAPAAALLVAGAVYADNGSWLDVAIAACGGGYALAAAAAASAAALAHARGHATAQRRGIVYKDATAFDAAARADVAVVCSRGTILLGEPEIVAVEAITKEGISSKGALPSSTSSTPTEHSLTERRTDPNDIARVLAIAAGAEISSTHPFASAILREARARGVRPDTMRSAVGHSGLGVTALSANGDRVIVGSRAFLLQEKVSVAIADARTSELEAQGRSVLLVAVGGRLVGLLALQDGLRPGARAAIQRLHDARIEPVLLSGEARDTCETIARALDVEHVRPEILPSDRGAEVRALADGGHVVAALGHASTDDGALGAADVSIAMEAAGAAPGEWAVALASDDVRDAALSLTVPRACRDRSRTVVVVGALSQAAGALGIAFGITPPAIVPVLGVLAAAAAVSIVREPEDAAK